MHLDSQHGDRNKCVLQRQEITRRQVVGIKDKKDYLPCSLGEAFHMYSAVFDLAFMSRALRKPQRRFSDCTCTIRNDAVASRYNRTGAFEAPPVPVTHTRGNWKPT